VRLSVLFDRLDVVVRRIEMVMRAEPPIDQNGRHHPALRSGRSARASARIGDRWHTLRHLFTRPRDARAGDISGVALAPTASGTAPAKTPSSGRNAAA
jgi:hypothetical protein